MTGAIRGTSKDKFYKHPSLEYLSFKRWFKRLCLFYKILKGLTPKYLYDLIPRPRHFKNIRNQQKIPQYFCRTNSFSNSFFPYSINEWNKLESTITQLNVFPSFRNALLTKIRPLPNSFYDACDPIGVQLLTRLRVGLSHLNKHKFRHSFNDTVNRLCPCNNEVESIAHFVLRCTNYNIQRNEFMNELSYLNNNLLQFDEMYVINLLLYGDKKLSNEINSRILNASITYILHTKRFEGPLF